MDIATLPFLLPPPLGTSFQHIPFRISYLFKYNLLIPVSTSQICIGVGSHSGVWHSTTSPHKPKKSDHPLISSHHLLIISQLELGNQVPLSPPGWNFWRTGLAKVCSDNYSCHEFMYATNCHNQRLACSSILPIFRLLHSFPSISAMFPKPWKAGAGLKHRFYLLHSTHSHLFSALWIVTSLCVNSYFHNKKLHWPRLRAAHVCRCKQKYWVESSLTIQMFRKININRFSPRSDNFLIQKDHVYRTRLKSLPWNRPQIQRGEQLFTPIEILTTVASLGTKPGKPIL